MASSRRHLLGKSISASDNMVAESCWFKVLCSRIEADNWTGFPVFNTGEHFWCISCLPSKDYVKGETGHFLFDLTYGGEWNDVKVNLNFGILKKDEALSSVKWITATHTFPECGEYFRLERFVAGDELRMYSIDDYFIILCKITILSTGNLGGITILSSLSGTFKSCYVEMQSLQNKDIASTSLIESERLEKKEMPSGLVHFKVESSHIIAKEGKHFFFPMFIVGEYCWDIWCMSYKGCKLGLSLYVRSETKNLKAGIECGMLKMDEFTSLVKGITTTHTFAKCGKNISMPSSDELKQHLQDDYFRIVCNLTILSETITSEHDVTIISAIGKPTHTIPSPNLYGHFNKLLQHKKKADVTFEVNGETFYAHRLVLAAWSTVFNDMLFGPTNENNMEIIKINAMDPRVFKAMMHFIYTDMLPNLNESSYCGSAENNQNNLLEMFHNLLAAADYYDLERLKLICEDKLSKMIAIDTVATILILAKNHNCPNLKDSCVDFIALPDNYTKVTITDGYVDMLVSDPTIIKEIRAKLKNISI